MLVDGGFHRFVTTICMQRVDAPRSRPGGGLSANQTAVSGPDDRIPTAARGRDASSEGWLSRVGRPEPDLTGTVDRYVK